MNKEIFKKELDNLVAEVNKLKTNVIGRRYFNDPLKKKIAIFFNKCGNNFEQKNEIVKELSLFSQVIHKWKREMLEGKAKPIAKLKIKKIQRKVGRSLKVKSSSGSKPRIIGTTLKNVLGNIDKGDLLQQVQMVDVLTDTGYEEDKLIEHLEIAAPSIEEWKQIKNALKLVTENFDIEVKSKT